MKSQELLREKEDELAQIILLLEQCTLQKKELEAELEEIKEAQEAQNIMKEKIQRSNAILLQSVQARSKELEEINYSLDQRIKEEIEKSRKQEQALLYQNRLVAMGEMVGNIAHQWRQPLNVLALKIQDLELAYHYNELNESYIQSVTQESMKQINYMSKTIDDFRNFVNPSSAEIRFVLSDCIDNAVKLVKGMLDDSSITVEVHNPIDSLKIIGNSSELKQVIVNLLNNSRDAFLEKLVSKRHIIIRTYTDDLSAIITFEDNAGGIPINVINRVFEPYFTTKGEGKGTGIGLYMSYMIVHDKMEGDIRVENIQDGARFTITLSRLYKED